MSVFKELKRRNVIRIGLAYVIAAWLIVQVVETIGPAFGFGDAVLKIVVIVLAIGVVPALGFAWAFELTPEGLKRDQEVDRARPAVAAYGRRLDRTIIVILTVAVGYFLVERFWPNSEAELSIAVLPFEDRSQSQDQDFFAKGISENLLNLLARLHGLRVTSRSSSFSVPDGMSTPEVADLLKVAYVLEGSVSKSGDRVRVTAQLIDTASDQQLWSDRYDRTMGDIFVLQDEIASRVVQELRMRLQESAPVSTVTDPEAFELVLKGRYEVSKRRRENLQQGEAFFEQAIAIDPDYAQAHAGLAKSLLLQAVLGFVEPSAARARAEEALDRALQLDPEDSDALTAKAFMFENTDPEAARDLYEQAIAVNPNNSDAYRWLGLSYSRSTEDPALYLEHIRRGQLVDPLSPGMNFNLVMALARFGRYDEALDAARAWRDLNPASPFPYGIVARVHVTTGNLVKAIKTAYAGYRLAPDNIGLVIGLAWSLFDDLEEMDLAEAWWAAAQKIDPENQGVVMLQIALSYMRGEQERALHLLSVAEAQHPDWWVLLGRMHVIVSRDFDRARQIWERGMYQAGESEPPNWELHRIIDYAMALQRTSSRERADELINKTLARIEDQTTAGLVGEMGGSGTQHFSAAALHAMRGDKQRVLTALRQDVRLGGASCFGCLHGWPQFDTLRDDPDFAELLSEIEAQVAAQRQQLADEGMLLTPEEVLALESLDFDPFSK